MLQTNKKAPRRSCDQRSGLRVMGLPCVLLWRIVRVDFHDVKPGDFALVERGSARSSEPIQYRGELPSCRCPAHAFYFTTVVFNEINEYLFAKWRGSQRMDRHVSRRTVAKLGYAVPLVAATMSMRTDPADAFFGTCDCYDAGLRFVVTNRGGACSPEGGLGPCGYCASCSPAAGAKCPETAFIVGGQIISCAGPGTDGGLTCVPVFRDICENVLSHR